MSHTSPDSVINIQSVPDRLGHLNILETVKYDKKLPPNNLVMVKSRSPSYTSQRTQQILLESFFVKLNGFQNIQMSRIFLIHPVWISFIYRIIDFLIFIVTFLE